jgi:hypothetical protein
MAITITDQPTRFARVGQKLMVVATSTNVGLPNFRYVVRVDNSLTSELISEFIFPPNPQNRLMIDIRDAIHHKLTEHGFLLDINGINYINNETNPWLSSFYYSNCLRIAITVCEAYDVGGVFTIDEASEVLVTVGGDGNFIMINAHHKVADGYKPNPNLTYSLTSTTSLLMGSRKPTTHYHNGTIQPAHTNQRVFIPVRRSELDWGVLNYIMQDGTQTALTTTNNGVVRMTLFESDGTPNQATISPITDNDSPEIAHIAVYPANLNAHGELLRPADYPNWRYYDIAIYDSANSSRKSALYTFYPVDDDCRFDNVRLAWWDDEVGGFDFFNFTKKNEQSVEVERKRIKPVVGTYAAASFTFNTFDSELKEGFIDAVDYIDITSDWIQEGEFELLKHLVRSEAVYIVGDDGTLTPVLVENSSYTAKRERSAKLYNQTFRLRYSQQQIR